MKILFVPISPAPFAPNDLLFYKAAENLLAAGHEVLVSPWDWKGRNASEYERLRQKGAMLHFRTRYERPDGFITRQLAKVRDRLRDPRKEWQFAEMSRPDAIVISDAATYHLLSVPGLCEFVERSGIPYFTISQYNDENTSLPEPAYRRAKGFFANARRCFFVSDRNRRVTQRQLAQDLPGAVVVHNPPNISDWTSISYPKTEQARFCIPARLECAVKGQALVFQILSEPLWRERDWHLTLYGRGPDERYLRDLARYLRLEGKVRFGGFSNDLRSVWAEEQILLMASSGEGKPLALTEAMLCGRTAVVTDVGGNAELVIDGVNGFVAQSATLASLKETMELAWINRPMWEDMGRQAHDSMSNGLLSPPGKAVATYIVDAISE
jgi:glycosyltransferase involved in cell wall biosynthesis